MILYTTCVTYGDEDVYLPTPVDFSSKGERKEEKIYADDRLFLVPSPPPPQLRLRPETLAVDHVSGGQGISDAMEAAKQKKMRKDLPNLKFPK